MSEKYQIVNFYEFKDLTSIRSLEDSRSVVREAMIECTVRGTVILAAEGFNATLSGRGGDIERFIASFETSFETKLAPKISLHEHMPFRKVDVKIRREIVTLRKDVDVSLARGTHLSADEWNALLKDDDVVILDTRNDYEYKNGTFRGAINPKTSKFSELPSFVEENMEKFAGKKVAMFCTGGIRCEKFAPYLISKGIENVFQLNGGILKYLEEVDPADSLWEGECFVFDERRTVDEKLEQGTGPDYSNRHRTA